MGRVLVRWSRSCFRLFFLALVGACFMCFVYYSLAQHDVIDYSDSPRQDLEKTNTQSERRHRVTKVCNILPIESNRPLDQNKLDHVIVDDKHKLLYCYVPKVACTNWKRVLMVINNQDRFVDPLNIPANDTHRANTFKTLNMYSNDEISYRIDKYFKFLFVRHPFDRLVSAYRNKFTQNYNVYFHNRYGRIIIQKYRSQASNESLRRGHDVTFPEFVMYLTNPETHAVPLNEHWRPVFELCHPCHISYDVIGKFETLDVDAEHVLKRIERDPIVSFPKKNKTNNKVTQELLASLSKEQVFRLYQLYALDFKMFNYSYQSFDDYLPEILEQKNNHNYYYYFNDSEQSIKYVR